MKIITIIMFASLVFAQQPKKFEVTFIVKYNEMTLKKASEKETMFKDLFKDACKIDVKVKEVSSLNNITNLTFSPDWQYLLDDNITGVDTVNTSHTLTIIKE